MRTFLASLFLMTWLQMPALGSINTDRATFMMPMNCAELLPDPAPYIGFIQATAQGIANEDRPTSKRLLRLLALRDKVAEDADRNREQNPVDVLVRKTICFYREQKDPLRAIPFDDPAYISFLKSSLKELEGKVDDAVFEVEFERAQRRQFESQLEKNQEAIERLAREAEKDADRTYKRIADSARKKVRQ